jgi:hypothetical protein
MFKVLLLSSLFLVGCSPIPTMHAGERRPTVCSIFATPKVFDGQVVTIEGLVDTDFREFSGVRDRGCPGKLLVFRGGPPPPKGNDKIEGELNKVRLNPDLKVHATVRGTVRHNPNQVPSVVVFVDEFSNISTEVASGRR